MSWLEEICSANNEFKKRISLDKLPVQRKPCSYAVITCMDPRVNLEAIGIPQFDKVGAGHSQVRIIRTIGARHEQRSLVIGCHLAGIKEVTVLMHTDCGCCLAHQKIDTIIDNMSKNLGTDKFTQMSQKLGEPFTPRLSDWLKTFDDPRTAVCQEVDVIKSSPYVPDSLIVHGLIVDLSSASVEVIVNGYRQ